MLTEEGDLVIIPPIQMVSDQLVDATGYVLGNLDMFSTTARDALIYRFNMHDILSKAVHDSYLVLRAAQHVVESGDLRPT